MLIPRLAALLLAVAFQGARADDCVPADPSSVLSTAQAKGQIIIKEAQAQAFVDGARALGVPITNADYVMLQSTPSQVHVEWLEGAGEAVGLVCGWEAKPESELGKFILTFINQKRNNEYRPVTSSNGLKKAINE